MRLIIGLKLEILYLQAEAKSMARDHLWLDYATVRVDRFLTLQ